MLFWWWMGAGAPVPVPSLGGSGRGRLELDAVQVGPEPRTATFRLTARLPYQAEGELVRRPVKKRRRRETGRAAVQLPSPAAGLAPLASEALVRAAIAAASRPPTPRKPLLAAFDLAGYAWARCDGALRYQAGHGEETLVTLLAALPL